MSKLLHVTQIIVLIALTLTVPPAWSDLDETYRISLGVSVTTFDTNATLDSRNDEIQEEIDFENDLGFDSEVRAGWLRGFWRFAQNHRMRLTYTPIRRSAGAVAKRDLEVGDYIIKSGASIQSNFKSDIFDIEYIYSLFNRPNLEFDISTGLYWLRNQSEITAAGDVAIEGSNETEFRSAFKTKQTVHAPLPLFGLAASYEVTPRWRIHGGARYMDASIDNINGRIISAGIGTNYYFTSHFGIGISVTTFDLKVDRAGVVFKNSLAWSHQGAQIYLVTKF
ncbi:hypothetical protein [Kaarinaea lacus]